MFLTYENVPRRYVMIHKVNCGQPGKLGRTEGYTSHATLENAQDYAKGRVNSGHAREWCHCQKCLRGTLPRHSGRR